MVSAQELYAAVVSMEALAPKAAAERATDTAAVNKQVADIEAVVYRTTEHAHAEIAALRQRLHELQTQAGRRGIGTAAGTRPSSMAPDFAGLERLLIELDTLRTERDAISRAIETARAEMRRLEALIAEEQRHARDRSKTHQLDLGRIALSLLGVGATMTVGFTSGGVLIAFLTGAVVLAAWVIGPSARMASVASKRGLGQLATSQRVGYGLLIGSITTLASLLLCQAHRPTANPHDYGISQSIPRALWSLGVLLAIAGIVIGARGSRVPEQPGPFAVGRPFAGSGPRPTWMTFPAPSGRNPSQPTSGPRSNGPQVGGYTPAPLLRAAQLNERRFGIPGSALGETTGKFGDVSGGQHGEQQTAHMLEEVLSRFSQSRVFHGLLIPGWKNGDMDHAVVLGTTVVFIDSKSWKDAEYAVNAYGQLIRDGQPFPGNEPPTHNEIAQWQALGLVPGTRVHGVIAIHTKRKPFSLAGYVTPGGVPMVAAKDLIATITPWLTAAGDRTDPQTVSDLIRYVQ